MNASVAKRFNISLGTTMVLTNILFLVPQLIWGRKLIGLGTIANMSLVGYTSDFCTMLENKFLPAEMFQTQPYRSITFAIALVLFLISAALYMNADLGLTPADSIPSMISQYSHLPFFAVRMGWDFLMILIGLLAGGKITIGTIILAFTIGPSVAWIGKLMKRTAR